MSRDDIHRLLGGYATNTLTEGERSALFAAALDDQELFNALQNEDALRELLDDPESRARVRQALQPAAARPRRAMWIGMTALAAAAAVIIAIVVWPRHQAPVAIAQQNAPQQIAQNRVEPKLEPPRAEAAKPLRKARPHRAAPGAEVQSRPLAAAPLAGLPPGVGGVINGVIGGAPPSSAALAFAPRQDPMATMVANASPYDGPLLHYSVLKSASNRDDVRIEVTSQRAGLLTLYRTDAAGQWQRIFPANEATFPVVANMAYQIPDSPITTRNPEEKLRLLLQPAPPSPVKTAPSASTGALDAPRIQAEAAVAAPIVVEIPIGKN